MYIIKDIILAFLGSIFPAVIFNIERKNLLWAGLSGIIGWIAFAAISKSTGSLALGALVGAILVGIYGETLARILKHPALVFTIPGIFPLVPGINAYNTVLAIVEGRIFDACHMGVETAAIAGAIAFGIMLASAIFKFIKVKNRIVNK